MLIRIFSNLKACCLALLVSDALFKATTFVLLTPLVSLLFRLFLKVSGRTVLADADIAEFLMHPLGWVAFVVVGGAFVAVYALEQAVLMTVCIGAYQHRPFRPRNVLLFVAARAARILGLTSRVVGLLAIQTIPFLAVAAVVYAVLLRQHDINFYLSIRPREFQLACLLIGLTAIGMLIWLLYKVTSWVFAMQLLLFEGFSPSASLTESRKRSSGHRRTIALMFAAWTLFNILLNALISFLIVTMAQNLVLPFSGSLLTMLTGMGLILALTFIANYLTSLIACASCASMLGLLYLDLAACRKVALPDIAELPGRFVLPVLTRGRLLSVFAISILGAMLIGAMVIDSIELQDRVQITAHRGGAGAAPENTLAAIRQAIADGAGWMEIDVQESSDGVVMVAHDSDLKKVAGKAVKIWQATAAELQSIDIGSYFDRRFQDERIPTLEEVLKLCHGRVGVNIELKYYGHNQNLEQKVVDLVEQFEMQQDVVIMSLDSRGIARMKKLRPDWTVGLLTAVAAGDLSRAPADFLAVSSSIATRPLIRAAQQRGKTVAVWTVNDPYLMSVMISRGVDNLITDYPDRARRVLAEREEMSLPERLMIELAFYLGVKRAAR